METIGMIQKPADMGNWWLAASLTQHNLSCIKSHVVFLWNIKSPRYSAPLELIFGALWPLAFPKTKTTFEREDISDHWWDSGKHDGAADDDGNCVRSRGAYFEGDWGIIVPCTTFLIIVYLQEMSLFFITHGWIPSGQTLCVPGLYPDPLKQTPEGKARKLAS